MKSISTVLTAPELELVLNADWIIAKNRIIEKVIQLMGELSADLQSLPKCFPDEVYLQGPKISRGEKYNELPYVILDQPRLFGREDVCAIRTLFWWGHYFMVTLHLKGKYARQYVPVLLNHTEKLAGAGFEYCVSGDEWEHEWTEDKYEPVRDHTDPASIQRLVHAEFYKLSARVPFDRWKEIKDLLLGLHQCLTECLTR